MLSPQALCNLIAAMMSFNAVRVLLAHNIVNTELYKMIAIGLYLLHIKHIIAFYNFVYLLQ